MSTSASQTPQDSESQDRQPATQDSSESSPENPPQEVLETGKTRQDQRTSAYYDLLEQQLREQNRTIGELQRRVEEKSQPTVTVDPETERIDWYQNPKESMRALIQEELRKTVAPLQEEVRTIIGGTALERYKKAYREHPQYKEIWGPDIDRTIDEAFSGPNAVLNDETIQAAIVYAVGRRAFSPKNQQPPLPTHDPNAGRAAVTTPPHLRPAAPVDPRTGQPAKKRRELTELEKRMARERKQTDDEYLDWLELPPDKVVTSTIGKPKA